MKFRQLLLAVAMILAATAQAQEELPPFYGIESSNNMEALKTELKSLVQESGFDMLGEYHVAGKSDLWVMAFSSDELKKLCGLFEDRGALASVQKIGLMKKESSVEISLLNPNYMFYAYLGANYEEHAKELSAIDLKIEKMLSDQYGELKGFGGGLTAEDLEKYHYKVMMPYFDDPIGLEAYENFEQGLAFIRQQIKNSGQNIQLVYELVNEEKKTAVFGIGLTSAETGEAHFLPIIGERHIAAMPYEIILQNNEVSMLAGKYRFALYWPELTMGEFMKIMSTPGDVADAMETVTVME